VTQNKTLTPGFTSLKANLHLSEGKEDISIYVINCRIVSNDAESAKL